VLRLAWGIGRRHPAALLNIIGHSWGALDAYRLARLLERAGVSVGNLITLDPVGWPFGRCPRGLPAARWLNVDCASSQPDDSDRMTERWPWSRKPSGLPVERAETNIVLDLNHWNVEAMMRLGGARARLDASWSEETSVGCVSRR
jgi:pimeloyl-ACP methyl ester carboxylesterase